MPSWIADIQGVTEIKFGATAEDRKHILTFPAGAGGNDGDETKVFPDAPYSIGGTDTASTLEDVIAALVALGLATDDR
jgi:hypothetical protein